MNIKGMDNSQEMLEKLKEKAPDAQLWQSDLETFETADRFDYIFISSGSVSLFTNMDDCRRMLRKMRTLLKPGGVFVFAVDTVFDRCPEDADYKVAVSVKTDVGDRIDLRSKDHYDEVTQTQYSPAYYELYHKDELVRSEKMDFQTHLYKLGEMEKLLADAGFEHVKVFANYNKDIATDNQTEMFLFECR